MFPFIVVKQRDNVYIQIIPFQNSQKTVNHHISERESLDPCKASMFLKFKDSPMEARSVGKFVKVLYLNEKKLPFESFIQQKYA